MGYRYDEKKMIFWNAYGMCKYRFSKNHRIKKNEDDEEE